jgi:hypothetical protein
VAQPKHERIDHGSRLVRPPGLAPEAIAARTPPPHGAQLVDAWGRHHGVASPTSIGRELGRVDLGVLEASVSRQHAELRHDPATGAWTVRDLGSSNGTFVDGRRIEGVTRLRGGEVVAVGHVGFVFLAEPPPVPAAGLRLRVGAGGGTVEQHGRVVWLGAAEVALLRRLAAQREGAPDGGRAFLPSTELAAALRAWHLDAAPADIAPLCRRAQAALVAAGLDDVVEHRARFGYRLRLPVDAVTVEAQDGPAAAQSTRVTLGMDAQDDDQPGGGR